MSVAVTRNNYFLGLADEVAALEFPDKEGKVDVQAECAVKLFPSRSLSSARDAGYEELFSCRNRVLWSSFGRERVRIETNKHIVDSTLCPMVEDDASVPVLCVAEQTVLTIYTAEGGVHHHSLPSPVKRLWPTPAGLVVEHHSSKPAHLVQNCITGVERLKAISNRELSCPINSWESQTVHFMSADSAYALTAHADARTFQVWCLKAFPEGVLKCVEPQWHRPPSATPNGLQRSPCTPATPVSRQSRVRTPDGNIQSFIFSNFCSQTFPGTASTTGPQQVCLMWI
jgi:Anaphase-promoting complex subunit 1